MLQEKTLIFNSDHQFESSINMLKNEINRKQINKILIQQFYNTFRIDHQIKIQSLVRETKGIQKVKFINTTLNKDNFTLFYSWLKQQQCQDFILHFNNNKLDDLEISDFINKILIGDQLIKDIYIINNAGIYKGLFIQQLKKTIRNLNMNNYVYEYALVQDKIHFSICITKFQFNDSLNYRNQVIEKINKKLIKTNNFSFSFNETFNQSNHRAFEYLINLNFNERGEDRISKISVSKCSCINIQAVCEQLSTAKGLLELSLEDSQKFLNFSVPIESLMGGRYHKLRVNKLNLEKNSQILEKTWKILSENIFLGVKELKFSSCLPQQLSTLYKFFVMTDAFLIQSQQLQQQSINEGKIYRQNMRKLDLSLLENYNRHDLIIKFLTSLVFNVTSNLKQLTIQNLDIGRAQAYITAFENFREKLQQLQEQYPVYQNFKFQLKSITLPKQTYRMEIPTIRRFFLEFFFTRVGSVLEIEEFNMIECFNQTNREEGLKENCAQILHDIQANPVQYSIKKVCFQSANYSFDSVTYRCLFLNNCFQIEELKIQKDTIAGEFFQYIEETNQFFQLQPAQYILPLKVLELDQIEDTKFSIGDLLEFLIFHPRIHLRKLVLKKITVLHSDQQLKQVEQFLQKQEPNKLFTLEELKLGSFLDDVGILPFFVYVLFNKFIKLKKLSLEDFDFQAILYPLEECLQENEDIISAPSQCLEELSISKILFEDSLSLQYFLTNFVFSENSKLQKLQIKNQSLDEMTSEALFKCYLDDEQQIYKLNLKKLIFKKCEITDDVLSPFIYGCQLNQISFKKCKLLDVGLQMSMDTYNQTNVKQYNRCQFTKFELFESQIEDVKIFKWFIKEFALNINQQRLVSLKLNDCQLSNEHLKLLEDQIIVIKNKNRLLLRNIELNKCNQLSEQYLIDFFNILYSTDLNAKKVIGKQNQSKKEQSKDQLDLDEELQRNLIEKIDEMQNKIVDVTLNQKELNLKTKILSNYEIFKPQFPQKLQCLLLNMGFPDTKPKEKQQIYQRLLSGLIFHPENQINELTLQSLDLVLFMELCKQCINYSIQYQQNCLKNLPNKQESKLKNLYIKGLTNQTQQSIENFVGLFICSQQMDLEKVILESFKQNLIKSILSQIQNRVDYKIKELTISCSEEKLTEAEMNKFFNLTVFEQRFPLEKLELLGLEFEKNSQISKRFVEKQGKQKIKQYDSQLKQFKIQVREIQDIEIYTSILGYIMSQPNTLEVLKILFEKTKNEDKELIKQVEQAFLNIFTSLNEKVQTVQQLLIKEIQIIGKILLDINFFQFLNKVSQTLEKFEANQVDFKWGPEIKETIEQFKRNKDQNLTLQIKEILGQSGYCFKEFIFDKNISATHIVINNPKNFESLNFKTTVYNIKSLKLDMGLIYSSPVRLKKESLKLISQTFIYNLDSNLEELLLYQCQLRPEEIDALCQPANEFREKIQKQQRQQQVTLKLKQFSIYYSLYIGDEGCRRISKDMIFFDYINIERIDFLVTNFSDQMCKFFVQAAKEWLQFQQENNRQYKDKYPLNYLDIGRNEFIQSKDVWCELLQTLVFTDKSDKLETFNIQFMAFNDETVSYVVEEAKQYLNNKPADFILPIKKINFSQNNALTHKGWKNLFDNFFLHKKVHLVELNMISTMLDTEIKLNTIYECIKHRALQEDNKKLKLEVFLCYNVSLKNAIYPYLQTPSKDYPKPKNLPVDIDYESWKYGIFDGIPEEFGSILMLLNTIIYKRNEFIETNKWKVQNDVRFPNYHLNFHEHYLNILNNYLKRNKEESIIYLNLKTLDSMCQFFNYTTQLPANPYPIRLLFSQEAIEYYKQSNIQLKKIRIINIPFSRLEQISQFDIFQIWQQIRQNNIQINQIEIEYYLNDDLVDLMLQKYNESDILDLIKLLPPSRIRIENTLTINALKRFLQILKEQYSFQPSIIKLSYNDWKNTGIAYQLREYAYNYKARNQLQANIKKILYEFSNLFVAQDQSYTYYELFDDLTIKFNKQNVLFYLSIYNLIYLFLIFILPFYDILQNQKQYNFRYYYLFIIFIGSIYEIILIKNIQIMKLGKQHSSLRNELINFNSIQQIIISFIEKCKILFDSYLLILLYQYSKFEFYLYLLLLMQHYGLQFIKVIQYLNKNNDLLCNLYDLSVYGKFNQLEKYLNDIIPYNCVVIKKQYFQMKNIIGKSINKQIYYNFIQLILKDIPQFILLSIFKLMNEIEFSFIFQICLIFNIIQIFESFRKIISYRPLMISQDDFENISKKIRKNYLKEKLLSLEKESKQLEIYSNFGIKKNDI